jgi:hypothetical protein
VLKGKKKTVECSYVYTADYVESLWDCIKDDLQDNTPTYEENYLKVLFSACQNYNELLGTDTFDAGG